ncbi:glycosyltransferase [Arthrobacter sp. APC 3897]|uniref:glycosyltransferase family protein n=1 Tax=Arthrobacter sp. APC 3897 TaxID=3035204 RepID=UPI0025B4F715|nr:glycosyltransferase [Arthrobacter sp. APC 3897]MDN3482569.1 glycosyltransferase [Arthrobacter sp. APC 3897]
MTPSNRPRLLFFRWAKPGLPGFLNRHLDEHVHTLGHFFEVRVIDTDCDYAAECDAFTPDLCVFESGVYAGERSIRNTSSRPDIPKLGFLHSDPYDLARAVFLSDMDRWGVQEFFTTSTAMAEYTPEIAERLFVWPNSVDPAVFRAYPVEKNIPVLFTGSQERHYPWRNAVGRVLSASFATMTLPHYGWGKGGGRTVFGEDYARLLSASIFVPACGSMSRDLVRKHLEIPAAGACLVAEDTPALAAFGFVDMANCVLGEAEELPEKLDALLADPGRLAAIVRAGQDLVQERHVQARRSQVLEWLQLQAVRRPGEVIAQAGPAGNLFLATENSLPEPFTAGGRDREFLAAGWQLLAEGEPGDARREFLKCLNYYFIPEAVVGAVFAELASGNAEAARDFSTQALVDTFTDRAAPDPDPVLWATHLRALLCAGERRQAEAAALQFGNLQHSELDRMRRLLGVPMKNDGRFRASVCPVPARTQEGWDTELAQQLTACGQPLEGFCFGHGTLAGTEPGQGSRMVPVGAARLPEGATALPGRALSFTRRARQRVLRRIRWRLRTGKVRALRMALSPLKQRVLTDGFSRFLTDVLRREGLDSALLFGEPSGGRLQRALRQGLDLNPSRPPLTVVPPGGKFPGAASAASSGAGQENKARERTAVFVADPDAAAEALEFLSGCALVVLADTLSPAGCWLLSGITAGSAMVLLAHDPVRGTALFGAAGGRGSQPAAKENAVARAGRSTP